jgi:Saxitoxin biosynthesis operon protein SxtJ
LSKKLSLREDFRDDEPSKIGSDRAFGCVVGAGFAAIGTIKTIIAAEFTPISLLLIGIGALLVLLGVVAPGLLSVLNRVWLKLGAILAMVVNPIVLMILFVAVVTPTALVMRLAGKRPLRLTRDPNAVSYWIKREPLRGEASSMRQQF